MAEARTGHSVVIGGSMAGLLATRVLADRFARVTLLERDPFADGAASRKGVPQGRHVHGLLARGEETLSRLFPGLTDDLVRGGSTRVDMGAELRWHHFGGVKRPHASGLVGYAQSRPYLEWHVRRRVLALPNVECRPECVAEELLTGAGRVTGVRVVQGGSREDLRADLVVDASGRGSRTPRWLEAMGYGRPAETSVPVDVGYATRVYRRQAGDLAEAKMLFVLPTPPLERRLGVLMPIEQERWIVTLGGWLGDHPPLEPRAFEEFARSLSSPELYDVMRRLEPLSDIVLHKYPANLRRHYERMRSLPEGLLALGDAVCSFNPIYGQGMTSSAMQAEALAESLGEQAGEGLPQRFYRRAARVVDRPWGLATAEDFRYPEVTGPRPWGFALASWYAGRVHRAATRDARVHGEFLRVMNLQAGSERLLRAGTVVRALLRGGEQDGHESL